VFGGHYMMNRLPRSYTHLLSVALIIAVVRSPKTVTDKLQRVLNYAARVVTHIYMYTECANKKKQSPRKKFGEDSTGLSQTFGICM